MTRSCMRGGWNRGASLRIPGARTAEKAAQKVRLLIDAGVDTVIDLTTPDDHLEPYDDVLQVAAEKAGRQVRHFAYPIPDMGVIDPKGYDEIVGRIRGEIDAGRVVYVHCWGGKGRTCTVIGWLLIGDGLDNDATIARIAELRAGTQKAITLARSRRLSIECCENARLCASSRRRIGVKALSRPSPLVMTFRAVTPFFRDAKPVSQGGMTIWVCRSSLGKPAPDSSRHIGARPTG